MQTDHATSIRSDPTTGAVKAGALLALTFNVSQIAGGDCTPLAGATVDVWHCDALGIYSDVSDSGFNTKGQKFLRGYQVTDANGTVTFTTICDVPDRAGFVDDWRRTVGRSTSGRAVSGPQYSAASIAHTQ
jgi:protocatechuate 3,4-dioxygenase beta subunit